MNADEYQRQAARTLIDNDAVPDFDVEHVAIARDLLDLAKIVGQEVDAVKKAVFHAHGYDLAARNQTITQLRQVSRIATSLADCLCGDDDFWPSLERVQMLSAYGTRLLWNGMGVVGEAAEISDLLLAALAQPSMSTDATAKLSKEIGDVCWYLAALCTMRRLDFGQVLTANIAKLQARYPDGWDEQRSQQRAEGDL